MQRHAGRHTMPLYAQVASALRGEIEAGEWARGEQLPAIDELAMRFGVARATLRQAIEVIEGEGLVECQHGRGTFVACDPREQRWLRLASDWDSFLAMIEPLEPKILKTEAAERQPPVFEGEGRPAAAYQHIQRVHYKEGAPFCTLDNYLSADIYLRYRERLQVELVMPVLAGAQDIEIDRVHQTLTVNGANQSNAELLDLPLGAPVATVRRTIKDKAGTCIFVADLVYRGDVVKLDIDLSPPAGYRQKTGAAPK